MAYYWYGYRYPTGRRSRRGRSYSRSYSSKYPKSYKKRSAFKNWHKYSGTYANEL